MSYAERFRDFARSQKMTQKELGKRAGLTPSTISRILTGEKEPKLSEAYVLARELGVTLNDIVEEEPVGSSATGLLIRVSQDDLCLLKVAHTLGVDRALARLVNAEPPQTEIPRTAR